MRSLLLSDLSYSPNLNTIAKPHVKRLSAVPYRSLVSKYAAIVCGVGFNEKLQWSSPVMGTNEELVVQNLRREPHSSVTVRCFRKQKSCCHLIAIITVRNNSF